MSKAIKMMYEFSAKTVKLVEETREEVDSTGKKRKVIESVEKETEQKYAIRRPNRILYENYDMFYGPYLSKLIRGGHLTTQMLYKRFDDDDGILSKSERAEYKGLKELFLETSAKINRIELIEEDNRTEEQKQELAEALEKRDFIRDRIIDIEMSQNHLFEQTAENKARIKGLFWWLMFLTYVDKNGEWKPLFLSDKVIENSEDDDFDSRLSVYDEFDESENKEVLGVIRRVVYLISMWSSNQNMKEQKDFEKFDKNYFKEINKAEEEKQEAEKEAEKEAGKEAGEEAGEEMGKEDQDAEANVEISAEKPVEDSVEIAPRPPKRKSSKSS